MPYATPADPSSSTTTAIRPGHRRSRSSFSDERGPGAFVSLGVLPRRRQTSTGSAPGTPKKAVFHLNVDDESPQEDPTSPSASADTIPNNSLRLTIDTHGRAPPSRIELPKHDPASVPFPSAGSPLLSPGAYESPFMPSPPSSTPGSLSRTPSSSIILSNGKPLKSSLKSSSSSPNVVAGFSHGGARITKHMRVQSAPSTPRVHFAEKNALESVKLFHRTGKPASLSKPPGDETETETEAESYPFPSFMSSSSSSSSQSLTPPTQIIHEIDSNDTSRVPNPVPAPHAAIHVESVTLPRTRPPTLRGTVLVRNLAFEKHVAVRFTLDDWQTTSEVTCRHVVSLPGLPPPFPRYTKHIGDVASGVPGGERSLLSEPEGLTDDDGPSWDRFSFTIRLEDYESKLSDRTLFLVARYNPGNGGEYWDNNGGSNYRISFRRAAPSPLGGPTRPPFTTANSFDLERLGIAQNGAMANGALDRLLRSVDSGGMGMGMGTGTHAQQRTFSAPSAVRFTPPTGAVPAVVSRVAVGATNEGTPHAHWRSDRDLVVTSPEVPASTSGVEAADGAEETSTDRAVNADIEALRNVVPLMRRHSAPHPARLDMAHFPMPPPIAIPRNAAAMTSSAPSTSMAGTGKAAGAYIARRLSLSNYVAPGAKSAAAGAGAEKTGAKTTLGMATPPTTPPKEETPLPSEEKQEEKINDSARLSPLVIIGGMPATTLETFDTSLPPSATTSPRRSPSPSSYISGTSSADSSSSSTPSLSMSPSASDNDSTPTLEHPHGPSAVGMERTPSETLDADTDKTPFSPTGRRAPTFAGLAIGGGLVSPPESEDGSARSSPAGTGRSSPTNSYPNAAPGPSSLSYPPSYYYNTYNNGTIDFDAALLDPAALAQTLNPSDPDAPRVGPTDSSYAALVRQWCFAQSAPPTPGVLTPGENGASPVPTPSPPIPASMGSLGGMNLGMGLGAVHAFGLGGLSSGGPTPRRQQAWPAEQQMGVGNGMGLGGYGFPGFGFAGGPGRRGGATMEGVVGAQLR